MLNGPTTCWYYAHSKCHSKLFEQHKEWSVYHCRHPVQFWALATMKTVSSLRVLCYECMGGCTWGVGGWRCVCHVCMATGCMLPEFLWDSPSLFLAFCEVCTLESRGAPWETDASATQGRCCICCEQGLREGVYIIQQLADEAI
jgi:hypothetical protein